MASESSHQVDALANELAKLEQQSAALVQAINSARKARTCLLLALVVFVVIIAVFVKRTVDPYRGEENMARILNTLQERANKRMPDLIREIQTLADNVTPKVTSAFMQRAKDDMPLYLQEMEKERSKLVGNVEKKLTDKLMEHQQTILADVRKTIEKEFPEAKNPEDYDRMMQNLEKAVRTLVARHYGEALRAQLLRMYELWDQVPPAPPAKPDELPLADQLVGHIVEMAKLLIVESDKVSKG